MTTALQFLQLDAVSAQPFAIRIGLCQLFLNLAIVVYLALLGINKQNLTRLQTALADHITRFEVHNTNLRGNNYHTALGDGITTGTQTVSVQHTTCITAITEQQSGRTVPRFHQDRMILIESLQILRDGILIVKALGYQDGHRLWQRKTTHHQELEHVVKTGRVAHAFLYDGAQVFDVTQCLATQDTFTRFHPTAVTTDSVNLAVVSQKAEGLCQLPFREGIGRES